MTRMLIPNAARLAVTPLVAAILLLMIVGSGIPALGINSARAEAESAPKPAPVFRLWTGPAIGKDRSKIPYAPGLKHQTLHVASPSYKFLHGAAIVHFKGTFFANWANSPTNENGPDETLQGRRSTDGGKTWSAVEVIGSGFKNSPDRHSHGVYLEHKGKLWTICARFGVGPKAKRFAGLRSEAFVLNEKTDRWESRGIVMADCWPCDQPTRMGNGNYIAGGMNRNGHPVVAISHGGDLTRWDTVLIPFSKKLSPSYAETSVWAKGNRVMAVIRGGGNVAWVATSLDAGRTWQQAKASNMSMPRAKAYLGELSTGQLYMVSNLGNRDTLVISVGEPGEGSLSSMWRLRDGKSGPPRFKGKAKGKQWSYPYACEHDGFLYVVYSIGKEDCGLTTIPVRSLATK